MSLFRTLQSFKKSLSSYQPLIEVRIDRAKLIQNLREYQKKAPGVNVAPVLKSNAYGHGLIPVAQTLDPFICEDKKRSKASFFVVDSLYEAQQLRLEGIRAKIVVIGYTPLPNILSNRLKHVAFTIISLAELKTLALKKPTSFHLKIDTGMHRQGLLLQEIEPAIQILKSNPKIRLEGVCSHFADADGEDEKFTQKQIHAWEKALELFKPHFSTIEFTHLSNTPGAKFADRIAANTMRVGIGLFSGVLEIHSVVSGVKTIEPGDCVGYGCTFRAEKIMRIATIPAGFFEGIDRRLSNQGFVKIRDRFCPIIGRVSMNITSVDVSAFLDINVGEKVIIRSANSKDPNSIENIAKMCNTVPYEILVQVPSQLRRILI